MQIKDLLTEYDESIEANAYRDPMGLQIIWSAVGQNIFGRNLTSISNDLRNFNINLFNHWIVKDLSEGDHSIQLNRKTKAIDSEIALKTGLIIFLENLLIYIFVESGKDSRGLLGTQKARNMLSAAKRQANPKPVIISVHVSEHEILTRQISLGVNGRYRTPFIEAGLMDKYYNYAPYGSAWKEVDLLFQGNSYGALAGMVKELVQKLFEDPQNDKIPQIELNTVFSDKEITDLYLSCFDEKMRAMKDRFLGFWRKRLKLEGGTTAGVLYESVQRVIGQNRETDLNTKSEPVIKQVIDEALRDPELTDEHGSRIDDIKKLEPFLVSINFLFKMICAKDIKIVEDLQIALDRIKDMAGEPIDILLRLKVQAETASAVCKKISGDSSERLQQLVGIDFSNLTQCIQGIQKYHGLVMERRGNNAWFSFDGMNIKHNVREYTTESIRLAEWENSYYIYSLISLCRGMEDLNREASE